MSIGPVSVSGVATPGAQLSQFSLAAAAAVTNGPTAYDYDKTNGIANNPANIGIGASGQFYSYVDCSTWVNYALSSISSIHAAIVGAERNNQIFNPVLAGLEPYHVEAYDPDTSSHSTLVPMHQALQPWPQANVHSYFFDTVADTTNGFTKVAGVAGLQAGDLLAWSLGIYADPTNPNAASDPTLTTANDTGHVMVVVGSALLFQPEAGGNAKVEAGLGTDPTTGNPYAIYAVPVVDSSNIPHARTHAGFDPPVADSRDYTKTDLPAEAPKGAMAGGLGTGTIYFGVDANGAMQQFRFDMNSADSWHPLAGDGIAQKVTIAAAHLEDSIVLAGTMLDERNNLVVNLLSNASPTLNGIAYDTVPITLTGGGGLDLDGSGSLKLLGVNTYSGGTLLDGEGGTLELGNLEAAGTGAIRFGNGTQTLRIDEHGSLANHIANFERGDTIDLQAVRYTQSGTLRYEAATGTLHLGQDATAMTLRIDAAPAGSGFALSPDSDGSTLVQIQPSPSVPTRHVPFDNELYLAHNPDVAQSGMHPLTHFLKFGRAEGRQAYADTDKTPDISAHSGFDAEYYLLSNPDVAMAAPAGSLGEAFAFAYLHYETFGWHEGRNPNALFDVGNYLALNGDVAAAGVDPLQHYHQFGWHEGRDPSAGFDTSAYLANNTDVAASGGDPMMHYLQFGALEGRSPLG